MNIVILVGIILFALGLVLFLLAIVFIVLKDLKKNYFPSWTFLDYVSVGYLDHLYKKYIKRI